MDQAPYPLDQIGRAAVLAAIPEAKVRAVDHQARTTDCGKRDQQSTIGSDAAWDQPR
jgi:hypothetical protein